MSGRGHTAWKFWDILVKNAKAVVDPRGAGMQDFASWLWAVEELKRQQRDQERLRARRPEIYEFLKRWAARLADGIPGAYETMLRRIDDADEG